MIRAGEGTCRCGTTGPLVLDPYGGAPTCEGCYQPPRQGIAAAATTSDAGSPRARKRHRSVEHLVALAAAEDYRALYTSLLAALPRCMGECGRPSRYMTTYSSEFSCGRAGCERPDHDGDKWTATPWKDHVDAAEALSPPGRRTRQKKNKTAAASALEVTAEDRAMASGHNLMSKHEDDAGGGAVGPAS